MITDELDSKLKQLETSVKQLRKHGTELAEAEKAYKIELSKEALRLEEQGAKATMIALRIYGEGKVPKLRLERDIANTVYQANMEAINDLKLEIRVIENQIEREWGQANRT